MPLYTFEGSVPTTLSTWQSPREFAELHRLSWYQEGQKFWSSGNVLPVSGRCFADHLEENKITYSVTQPSLRRLRSVGLADLCLTDSEPMRTSRSKRITQLMGVKLFGDLPQCPFNEIIGRARREPGLPMLPHLTEILRFMIEYEVEFDDLSPCEVFRTPIGELGLTTRVATPIVRAGFRWAELLLYVSAEDLLAIDKMGSIGLKKLEGALDRHDMRLLPG